MTKKITTAENVEIKSSRFKGDCTQMNKILLCKMKNYEKKEGKENEATY